MHTIFSTEGLNADRAFRRWRDALSPQFAPVEYTRLDDSPFHARIEVAEIGGLPFSRISNGAIRTEATPESVRRHRKDKLGIALKLAGQSIVTHHGREAVQRAGDILVFDERPLVIVNDPTTRVLFLEVPRERLERALGPARAYAALTAGSEQATVALTTNFFNELVRIHAQLTPEAAVQMVNIGLDLLVASLAERLAREVSRPLHGTVIVQRAKAFIEANYGDPALDPPRLAGAVGVSLRRLQELFSERGQHVSDTIWRYRLDCAARRLADPAFLHLSIGAIAYGCGFASQAHFSRRFRSWFGLSPRDHRQMNLGR